MGQRQSRLALADGRLPTESREQRYEPKHRGPKIARKPTENDRKSIENRSKIVTKSLFDGKGDQNHPWTAFGTMLWTPKTPPGRSKSGLGIPLGLPKAPGERFWACRGRSKTRLKNPRAALGARLSRRAPPKTLVDQFFKVFATRLQRFF